MSKVFHFFFQEMTFARLSYLLLVAAGTLVEGMLRVVQRKPQTQ